MDSTYIVFHTTRGDLCPPNIDFDILSDPELEALVQKTRDAALSLDIELERRHSSILVAPSNLVKDCENKLQSTLQSFNILGCLDARTTKSVELAVSILTNEQTVRGSRVYQDFLNDIIRHYGRRLALLSAAGLGKHKIIGMNAESRTSLVHHLKRKKKSLSSTVLESLAAQYQFLSETGTALDSVADSLTELESNDQPSTSPVQIQSREKGPTQVSGVKYTTSQMPDQGHGQDFTTNVDEQRHRSLHCESAHYSSLPYEQERPAAINSVPPSEEKREMKKMCTNAPASDIPKLPEPFRTAVQNSRLWNWERSQKELKTTGCLATLFPKNDRQDVSFTIWCGNEDGYLLTDFFGLQYEISF